MRAALTLTFVQSGPSRTATILSTIATPRWQSSRGSTWSPSSRILIQVTTSSSGSSLPRGSTSQHSHIRHSRSLFQPVGLGNTATASITWMRRKGRIARLMGRPYPLQASTVGCRRRGTRRGISRLRSGQRLFITDGVSETILRGQPARLARTRRFRPAWPPRVPKYEYGPFCFGLPDADGRAGRDVPARRCAVLGIRFKEALAYSLTKNIIG